MSKTTTREILEGLSTPELNALRRRMEWCGAGYSPTRSELIGNINRSVTGNIERGNLTVSKLIRAINDDVVSLGPNKLETQIEGILENTTISKVAQWSQGQTERVACTHLYGILQGRLGQRFDIYQEKEVGDNKRLDIYLKDTVSGQEYLVESKVGKTFSKTKLKAKLDTYHSLLDNRRKTYILILAFDDLFWQLKEKSKQTQLEDYLSEDTISRLESIDSDTEVLLNLNSPKED